MGEDVNTVSPTLGFIIKTIDYEGYKLNICMRQPLLRLSGASLLVFANKTDVGGCMNEREILEGLQLESIRTHRWNVLRCSAMTGTNLKEGLAWVVDDAKKRLFLY
ncbi:ADP-ribosylation factor-like protein 2 like [Verticillium longisporum]|nr:ADP-ribosylation factor-like protein 2 like [Verticillium longisporum]